MPRCCQGDYREQLAQNPELTFTATVGHLCCAIRKLAAHTPPSEAKGTLRPSPTPKQHPSGTHAAFKQRPTPPRPSSSPAQARCTAA